MILHDDNFVNDDALDDDPTQVLSSHTCTAYLINFIFQRFCPCKKMTNIRYDARAPLQDRICDNLALLDCNLSALLLCSLLAIHIDTKICLFAA